MSTAGPPQGAPVSRRPWLFVGNSHLICIYQAMRRVARTLQADDQIEASIPVDLWRRARLQRPDGQMLSCLRLGPSAFTRPLAELAGILASGVAAELEALRPGLIVSALGGETPSVLGLPEHPVAFDYFEHPDDGPTPAPASSSQPRQVLPARAATALLFRHSETLVQLCSTLRQLAPDIPVVHLLAPPPTRDPMAVTGARDLVLDAVHQQALAPLSLRLRIHRSYCANLRQRLAHLSIPCLDTPEGGADAEGALAAAHERDAVHANAGYGALQLRQLENLR